MRFSADELVEQLVLLIKRFGEVIDIDKALARAKEIVKEEARSQSFDVQLKTLLDKGYPEAAGMLVDRFVDLVNPLRENFQSGSVIVVPESMVSLGKQMTMVKLDGKRGYAYIDTTKIYNAEGVKTLRKPYLVHDIEDGKEMLGISSDDGVKKFKKQNRFGLTAQEGIAVVTHRPEILKDHYMDFPGSCSMSSTSVLGIYLDEGRPILDWVKADSDSSRWGSASCGSRDS